MISRQRVQQHSHAAFSKQEGAQFGPWIPLMRAHDVILCSKTEGLDLAFNKKSSQNSMASWKFLQYTHLN